MIVDRINLDRDHRLLGGRGVLRLLGGRLFLLLAQVALAEALPLERCETARALLGRRRLALGRGVRTFDRHLGLADLLGDLDVTVTRLEVLRLEFGQVQVVVRRQALEKGAIALANEGIARKGKVGRHFFFFVILDYGPETLTVTQPNFSRWC